jgi:hypothetical protein
MREWSSIAKTGYHTQAKTYHSDSSHGFAQQEGSQVACSSTDKEIGEGMKNHCHSLHYINKIKIGLGY